jgi:hypothetical protein
MVVENTRVTCRIAVIKALHKLVARSTKSVVLTTEFGLFGKATDLRLTIDERLFFYGKNKAKWLIFFEYYATGTHDLPIHCKWVRLVVFEGATGGAHR